MNHPEVDVDHILRSQGVASREDDRQGYALGPTEVENEGISIS